MTQTQSSKTTPTLIPLSEAAIRLGVSELWLQRKALRGRIDCVRLHRKHLAFTEDQLTKLITDNTQTAKKTMEAARRQKTVASTIPQQISSDPDMRRPTAKGGIRSAVHQTEECCATRIRNLVSEMSEMENR